MSAAPPPSQKFTGAIFNAYVQAVARMGLDKEVRARVPPDVAQLMDRPPLPTQWMEGSPLGTILSALHELRGLQGVRDIAYEANRTTVGKVLEPLLKSTLALHGGGPETLFTHMDTFARPFFKSERFQYTPEGPRSGTLRIRADYAMGPAPWAAWEGTLHMFFDACQVKGTVAPAVISERGHVADIKVSW